MTIAAYTLRTGRVPLGKDNSFEVRALTFPDIAAMISNNRETLVAIIAKYQEAQGDVYSRRNISELAFMIARDFPTLSTEIISASVHGEVVTEETKLKIAMFPAPIQMAALIEIVKITVEEAGGLGNLMADFRQRIQEALAAGESSDSSPIPN